MYELHICYKEGRKMNRKTVSGIMLTPLLIGMVTLAFNTEPVKAEYEFYDDFDGGLVQWNNFGYPTPSTFQDPGFHDGWGYSTEGDGWHQSGSWSKTLLDISNGITVEFRVKQDAGNVWDMFNIIGVGKLQSGYSEDYWPHYFGVGIDGHNPDNNPEGTDHIFYLTDTAYYIEYAANDHQFHTYKIKYDESSNEVEFYKDDNLVTTLTAGPRPYDELPLLISGRDYHNTNYLDWIHAYSAPTAIPATIDIDPDTLNLKSNGQWITAYIELPEDCDVSDIDISTVKLNDEIPAELHPTEIGDYDTDGITDLMVKFNRPDLVAILGVGEATLTITGKVNDVPFEGSDTIRVIDE